MELIVLIEIIVAIFILGLISLFNSSGQRKTSTYFFLITISIILWMVFNYLGDYFLLIRNNLEMSLLFARLTVFSGVLIAANFYLLSLYFPRPSVLKRQGLALALVLTSLLTFFILSMTSLIIRGVNTINGSAEITNGSLYVLFAVFFGAYFLLAFYNLYNKYKGGTNIERVQLKFFIAGAVITLLFASLFNIVLPTLLNDYHYSKYGPYFVIFFVLFTFYGVTKHGLFNTKIIISEMVTVGIVMITGLQLFSSKSVIDFLLKAVSFILVLFFGFWLTKSVRSEVEKREEVERLAKERSEALDELGVRNKNLAGLQKISSVVLNEIDMKPMAQKILDQIPDQLENCTGALLILKEKENLIPLAMSRSAFSDKINTLIGKALESYALPVKKDHNLVHKAFVERKDIHGEDLSDFISPPISKSVAVMIQKVAGMKYFIAMPMSSGAEQLGVLMFTFKVVADEIDKDEVDMIEAISTEMSLAIQRAMAFKKLQDANEYLSQLDKMKDEFISVASHELNTPLAAIEGYLSMVLDENMGKIDKQSREYLSRAYASSKRLADLIMDLLNVSRIEQGRIQLSFKEANLYDLAQSVVHELQVKADGKKVYLKLDGKKTDIPITWCDTDRIREVMVNLAGNAIKFTEKGGVTIRMSDGNHIIRCEVEDTGKGITEEGISRLFQKFSQVNREKDQQQGTGLGLYISRNFVELHKGKIWVESKPGKGSKFIFEIPVIKTAPKDTINAQLFSKDMNKARVTSGEKGVPAIVTDSVKKEA